MNLEQGQDIQYKRSLVINSWRELRHRPQQVTPGVEAGRTWLSFNIDMLSVLNTMPFSSQENVLTLSASVELRSPLRPSSVSMDTKEQEHKGGWQLLPDALLGVATP